MEPNGNVIEPLISRAEEYGKTSLELIKLKTLDKTSGVISTVISRTISVFFLVLFIVIVNIGLSLWLGELLGKSYYGFFCVAAFYALLWGVLHFFMHDWVKKQIGNSIISEMLN